MDGYAVRLDDVQKADAELTIVGHAPAGTPFSGALGPHQAVRIFTGGELPSGADHVVPQELTSATESTVTISKAYERAAHVRAKGVDFVEGTEIIPAGKRLGPAELALAAAANYEKLKVFKRVSVALLSNGDELRPPGAKLTRGQIISSNPFALKPLLESWGADVTNLGIASDNITDIQSRIERAEHSDLIVPIGGASVGDHDHMRRAFANLGYDPVFEKIAVKPGKPTWFSRKNEQRVLGLPGNPASALVCAQLFLPSLLDPDHQQVFRRAKLASQLPRNGARMRFLRAAASLDDTGTLTVEPATNQDSSLMTPFLSANCLLCQPSNHPHQDEGSLADVLLIGSL